jgi:hypothetical protein
MLCRSYGAYRNVDIDTYKYFAPTEHDLGWWKIKQPLCCVPLVFAYRAPYFVDFLLHLPGLT